MRREKLCRVTRLGMAQDEPNMAWWAQNLMKLSAGPYFMQWGTPRAVSNHYDLNKRFMSKCNKDAELSVCGLSALNCCEMYDAFSRTGEAESQLSIVRPGTLRDCESWPWTALIETVDLGPRKCQSDDHERGSCTEFCILKKIPRDSGHLGDSANDAEEGNPHTDGITAVLMDEKDPSMIGRKLGLNSEKLSWTHSCRQG